MYAVIVRLILLAALLELGMTLNDFTKCDSRECLVGIERASRKLLEIDWRPISVFPQEAKRFR